MSEVEVKATIRAFFKSLIMKDAEKMLSLCNEDVTLKWGHFMFRGKKKVKEWAEEMWQMFPRIRIVENKLMLNKNIVNHEFVIAFVGPSGRRGIQPAKGIYSFKRGKIQNISINPLLGVLLFNREEAEDLGIEPPKF